MSAAPLRVMLCDDSATVLNALARLLAADPEVRVACTARDGAEALARLADAAVEVVVLDVAMAGMDGLTALPLLLRAQPGLRVVMVSGLTTRGADASIQALLLGAADCVAKPDASARDINGFAGELLTRIKGMRRSDPAPGREAPRRRPGAATPRLLGIGSSTGGPQALATLLGGLGPRLPVPVVITQHLPPAFVPVLADRLSRVGGPACRPAWEGAALRPGEALLAPGNRHLTVEPDGPWFRARLSDGPPENHCRPSVDPMLRSAAAATSGRVLVAMLTGMGQDGLAGTSAVVAAGGTAVAQDEASSVVWGMPRAIVRAGLCHDVLPLARIAGRLRGLLEGRP